MDVAPMPTRQGAPQIEETEIMERLDQLEGSEFRRLVHNSRFPPVVRSADVNNGRFSAT
jgi:hypothetical protein